METVAPTLLGKSSAREKHITSHRGPSGCEELTHAARSSARNERQLCPQGTQAGHPGTTGLHGKCPDRGSPEPVSGRGMLQESWKRRHLLSWAPSAPRSRALRNWGRVAQAEDRPSRWQKAGDTPRGKPGGSSLQGESPRGVGLPGWGAGVPASEEAGDT